MLKCSIGTVMGLGRGGRGLMHLVPALPDTLNLVIVRDTNKTRASPIVSGSGHK